MAHHRGRSEATEAALARLEDVSLGDEIDYEEIGRIVVASLLARRASGKPGAGPEKIRATLEFAICLQEGSADMPPQVCCNCWRDEFDQWNCAGTCCPDNGWLD